MNKNTASSNPVTSLKGLVYGITMGLALATPVQANVNIADIPLFLSASVEPNLMFILDDSGSMQWEFMPDEDMHFSLYMFPRPNNLYGGSTYANQIPTFKDTNVHNFFGRSAANNSVFYNPDYTYVPWSNPDGSSMPDATPGAAYYNPRITGLGTLNLTAQQTQSATWFSHSTSLTSASCDPCGGNHTYWPITYFNYQGGDKLQFASYQKVQITTSTPSSATFTSPGGITRTRDEEIQNFANWFQYYRSRILAARAGIGRAFGQQGEDMRVGFGTLNKGSSDVDNVSTDTVVRGVRPFTGSDRDDFFDLLYDRNIPQSGTPLRRALDSAGQYFSRSDNRGPWGATPGTNDSTAQLECRQNFTILMTDGFWNSSQAGTSAARNNNDGTGGPTISGPDGMSYTYSAVTPFTDNHDNTLADVAMYYWKNDLRTGMDNIVPYSTFNPAFWQHMVTFGVGLGVSGTIDPQDAFDAIDSSASITWGDSDAVAEGHPYKIDDLLHAAVNSRGGFFSASDPITFADELSDILSTIVARVDSSATSAAASSATLQSDSLLYTAGFRAKDWSGQLIAREINPDGTVKTALKWNAEDELVTQAGNGTREIYTSVRSAINAGTHVLSGNGVKLDSTALGSLSTNQQNALNHAPDGTSDGLAVNRVEWLYGDESAHASFRSRQGVDSNGNAVTRLLGDVVGSNPQFAGKRDFGYRRLVGTGFSDVDPHSYIGFRASNAYQNRPDVLYVGANDGMLHAFDATTGEEVFAYMPSELLLPESGDSHARINHLVDADYDHRYYVDGTATVWDAHWGGSWKSVLVGTMGAGGRSVYALDVTYPQNFDQTKVLWEFTDPDLGYGVDKPSIVRMQNGEWAAVFGNGYNSANHKAVLFVVRLSDGQLLAKIDTNQASDTAASPNGLSTPTVTLSIDDLSANLIYAGDLKGRLWRFDVSSTNTNQWTNQGNRGVLFQAVDSGNNNPQPITSAPEVAVKPGDPNTLVVLFGTGSYFRDQDDGSSQIQSLYGIFDNGGTSVSRSQLAVQQIIWEGEETFGSQTFTLREISDVTIGNTQMGWVMDLIANSTFTGERVISKPVLLSGSTRDRIRFTTMIPNSDPCASDGGRDGFVMDLMIGSGGAAAFTVFDLNGDGKFDAADTKNGRNFSGVDYGGGEQLIVIQTGDGASKLYSGDPNSTAPPLSGLEPGTPSGRQSWRQLR